MRWRNDAVQSEHAKLVKSAHMLVTMTFCTVSMALAWFVYTDTAKTDGMEFLTVDAINSTIIVDGSAPSEHYTHTGTLEDIQELSGFGYVKDGSIQLWKPLKDPFTGAPIEEDGSWRLEPEALVANKDYLEFDVIVKANLPGTVYLSPESEIVPVDPDGTNRMSRFGNFSQDNIAAATRVSCSEVSSDSEGNTTETLSLIWAPNKDTELVPPKDDSGNSLETATKGWELKETDGTLQSYCYYDGTKMIQLNEGELNTSSVPLGESEQTFGFYDALTVPGARIGTLRAGQTSEEQGTSCHLKVRIWVEGCDREAKSPLTGGHFKIKLVFSNVADTEETPPESNT